MSGPSNMPRQSGVVYDHFGYPMQPPQQFSQQFSQPFLPKQSYGSQTYSSQSLNSTSMMPSQSSNQSLPQNTSFSSGSIGSNISTGPSISGSGNSVTGDFDESTPLTFDTRELVSAAARNTPSSSSSYGHAPFSRNNYGSNDQPYTFNNNTTHGPGASGTNVTIGMGSENSAGQVNIPPFQQTPNNFNQNIASTNSW